MTLRGEVDHFFHLAAIYDMTAGAEAQEVANVEGTRHAVELAGAIEAGCFHQVSSIAAAGLYKGEWREDMFDEAERLDTHPYFRTKHESERVVREECPRPWRVYRPGIVVGDSRTGEIDKIDGPYYFFKLLQRARRVLPSWLPTVGVEGGEINIVPVDYVAAAIDHIAHKPRPRRAGLPPHRPDAEDRRRGGQPLRQGGRRAAGGAAARLRRHRPGDRAGRAAALRLLPAGEAGGEARRSDELGMPAGVLTYVDYPTQLRLDQRRRRRWRAPGSRCRRWRPTPTGSGTTGSATSTPTSSRTARWRPRCAARSSSSPAPPRGSARRPRSRSPTPARRCCWSPARSRSWRRPKRRSRPAGGVAHIHRCDMSDIEDIERMAEEVLAYHGHVDILVNNAGRSIRRSVGLSYDRFHDYERTIQLNYLGAVRLILALLPSMRARKSGHIINISSIGTQTNPPRFSAYVASKAALDAFSRVIASEVIDDGVHITTIHMPLVRTPMIAPTRMYDMFPAITPEEAAEMIAKAMVDQPKKVATRLGTFGELLYAVAPTVSDRILNTAYKLFPESQAAKGKGEEAPDKAPSTEAVAFAHLMKGVHW